LLADEPDNAQLVYLDALCRERAGDRPTALASFRKSAQLDESFLPARCSVVLLLTQLQRTTEAAVEADRLLERFNGEEQAQSAAGEAYLSAGRYRDALASFDSVLEHNPADALPLLKRGFALAALKDYAGSHAAFETARRVDTQAVARFCVELSARPEAPATLVPEAIYLWTRYLALCACDWRDIDDIVAELRRAIASGAASREPALAFVAPLLPTTQTDRYNLARSIAAPIEERCAALPPTAVARAGRPLRVGILSPDFREHVSAHLLLPLFEMGNRRVLEYYAYSIGPDDGSHVRREIQRSAHRFRDLRTLPDRAAAEQIRRDEIDVLVDVAGYTTGSRFDIVARRPAPVQVSYLGFSSTLGSSRVDYVIADHVVLPLEDAPHWTEAVAHLPSTYFIYDFREPVRPTQARRADFGLPEDAMVFSAFHRAEKVEPESFGLWMRVLQQVPGSVLWLYSSHERMPANVRREAAARGVDPQRLLFVPRAGRDEYLARFRLADLLLDSLQFNATTTACDALAAGVPVLTCRGTTFTSRTAESLLCAAGLPELVAADREAFLEQAVQFAREPGRLAAVRERLAAARRSAPLFDVAARVKELEAAFLEMARRASAGVPPGPFSVLPGGRVEA
jgi:predicted O-linked N-acetylglucosamine transferase (SPINDLY family)